MTRKEIARPRLSPEDSVAALCRRPEYITDYESIRKWIEPALGPNADIYFRTDRDGKRTIHPILDAPEASAKITSFLDHWPMLRYPVPPREGKKDPANFVSFLRDPVEVVKGPPGKTGVHVLIDPGQFRVATSSNISQGMFLTVRTDLSRPIEELIGAFSNLVKDYQNVPDWSGFQVNLPAPKSRSAVKKKKTINRWETYDVFNGVGNRDPRKTAEILFPGSYQYKKDRTEVIDECDLWLAKKGGRKAPPKVMSAYETKTEHMKCSTERSRERKSIEKWILSAVQACERLIAAVSLHKEI
jgi:hypothetical protein